MCEMDFDDNPAISKKKKKRQLRILEDLMRLCIEVYCCSVFSNIINPRLGEELYLVTFFQFTASSLGETDNPHFPPVFFLLFVCFLVSVQNSKIKVS